MAGLRAHLLDAAAERLGLAVGLVLDLGLDVRLGAAGLALVRHPCLVLHNCGGFILLESSGDGLVARLLRMARRNVLDGAGLHAVVDLSGLGLAALAHAVADVVIRQLAIALQAPVALHELLAVARAGGRRLGGGAFLLVASLGRGLQLGDVCGKLAGVFVKLTLAIASAEADRLAHVA